MRGLPISTGTGVTLAPKSQPLPSLPPIRKRLTHSHRAASSITETIARAVSVRRVGL